MRSSICALPPSSYSYLETSPRPKPDLTVATRAAGKENLHFNDDEGDEAPFSLADTSTDDWTAAMAPTSPLFERGRLYDLYSARRNGDQVGVACATATHVLHVCRLQETTPATCCIVIKYGSSQVIIGAAAAIVPVGGAAATSGGDAAVAPKGNLHQTQPQNSASRSSRLKTFEEARSPSQQLALYVTVCNDKFLENLMYC